MSFYRLIEICTGREGRRGWGGGGGGWAAAPAPKKFWATQIFGAAREIWAKQVFKDFFKLFF